jgi:hypothetical protein
MRLLYRKSSKGKKRKGIKYKKSKRSADRSFEDKMNRRGTAYAVDKVPYMPM